MSEPEQERPEYGRPEQPRRGILDRYPAWLLILLIWFVGIPLLLLLVLVLLSFVGSLL